MTNLRILTIIVITLILPAVTGSAQAPPQADGANLLAFLDETIRWRSGLEAEAQLADQPADALYVNDDRQLAKQILALSFEFARADAQLFPGSPSAAAAVSSNPYRRLEQNAASAADEVKRAQSAIDALQQQLVTASAPDQARLEASIALEQSRLRLAQARKDALGSIVGFAAESGGIAGTDLPSQITALEQLVPATTASTMPPAAKRPPPSGLIGLITDLVWLHQKSSSLRQELQSIDVLIRDGHTFSAPLAAGLRQAAKEGAGLTSSNATDPQMIRQRGAEIDAITARMTKLSAAVVPLAKRRILLQSYETNLHRWRASVTEQYSEDLRRLAFRVTAIAIVLLLIFALSVFWRRMTFRYVHDVRHRHQLLLLRRIVMLIAVAAVIAVSFATDVGSLTTFVGLLTAGIAIAMQDVILSVAGYFVMIGKYGIRVGDRVRISAVTGDVLEVGLVWLYLMELEARGGDQLPTGRIVEFPNAVVFDHNAGIFKQLPGTRFLWHEVSVIMPPEADYRATQQRMLRAVEGVFDSYRTDIESQHREMERLLRLSTESPRPKSRLRVAPSGVEVTIRYPVELSKAAEIDDRVTAAINEERRRDATRPRMAS